MTDHEGNLDRETAERLLDSGPAIRPASPLADLLASASAPGRPHELSNEENVVLAFRAAVPGYPRPSRWRRLLTFKVIAAVMGTVTVGGLAFASSTGIIPGPFQSGRAPAPATTQATTPPGQRTASPAPEPSVVITEQEASGLCRAYLERPAEERGKALDAPAFSRLVQAAGGADRVPAFCAQQVEAEKNKPDKSHPARPSRPATPEPPATPGPPGQGKRSTAAR